MFENIGAPEFILIILIGLFIFGPDRLPKAINDGMRMLRTVRQMARNATGDLSKELGTDIQLEDLHPKTFLRKHLLSEEDEAALRKPLQGIYDDVRNTAESVKRDAQEAAAGAQSAVTPPKTAPATQPAVRPTWDDVT